jgi:hypothetical protein
MPVDQADQPTTAADSRSFDRSPKAPLQGPSLQKVRSAIGEGSASSTAVTVPRPEPFALWFQG